MPAFLTSPTPRGRSCTEPRRADELAVDAADAVMLLFQGATVRRSIQPSTDARALLEAAARLLP